MMDDDLHEAVKKCLDLLEENVEILTNHEFNLESEMEDELTPNMELYQLYDMAEDVSKSVKLKRAESNLVRRQTEDSF